MSADTRLPFITWMKATGMMLIVFGHVAANARLATLPPISTKQLGVAFFVFVTAFTLSRETRPSAEVVFRRLFEVYFFAVLVAFIVSACAFVAAGDIRESNYLPFAFGINVLLNYFPANPTTWYVGTYLHLVVLWVMIRGKWHVQPWHVLLVAVAEIVIRAALLRWDLNYVAYMILPNWATPFALGLMFGQRHRSSEHAVTLSVAAVLVLLAALMLTPQTRATFPFQTPVDGRMTSMLEVSLIVTLVYSSATLFAFFALLPLTTAPLRVVSFVADHTLVIFLAHMPLYYVLVHPITPYVGNMRGVVLFFICTFVPALASWLFALTVDVKALRNRIWQRMSSPVASAIVS